jgi:hypothetical protein
MNFGLSLANGKVNGIKTDLLALNNNHEPESNEAALLTYSRLMMPERNLDETVKRLSPLLSHPDLHTKIEAAGNNYLSPSSMTGNKITVADSKATVKTGSPNDKGYNSLAQVVGVIIGSPEFQRR